YGNGKKDPEILIVSPILIGEEIDRTCSFGEHSAPFSRLFSKEFGRVAREQGTFFMDAAKFAGPSREDNLHMTPAGHAALAKAMTEKVLEILG
ncbi:MAG: G-D-S-L family lipolytic protein, partial [Clostridia bacterium]|nr:G-D-S-L family lipolytic protein [Clostridia bacterium]